MPCLSMLTEPLLLRFNSENSSESLWPLNSTSAAHQTPTRIRPVWAIWLRPKTAAATLGNNGRVCNDPSEADRREISNLQQKGLRVDRSLRKVTSGRKGRHPGQMLRRGGKHRREGGSSPRPKRTASHPPLTALLGALSMQSPLLGAVPSSSPASV